MSSYRYVFLHIGSYRGHFSAQLFGLILQNLHGLSFLFPRHFVSKARKSLFSKVSRTWVWTKRRVGHVLLFGLLVVSFRNINATFVRVKRVRWNKLEKGYTKKSPTLFQSQRERSNTNLTVFSLVVFPRFRFLCNYIKCLYFFATVCTATFDRYWIIPACTENVVASQSLATDQCNF